MQVLLLSNPRPQKKHPRPEDLTRLKALGRGAAARGLCLPQLHGRVAGSSPRAQFWGLTHNIPASGTEPRHGLAVRTPSPKPAGFSPR